MQTQNGARLVIERRFAFLQNLRAPHPIRTDDLRITNALLYRLS